MTFNYDIFNDRYAKFPGETWEQAAKRIAEWAASVESNEFDREFWYANFYSAIADKKLIPAGRIIRAAGSKETLSAFNCYVLPSPHDSRMGIVDTLGKMINIMSAGGGVGITLTTLRPRNAKVYGVDGKSSGAVSWGQLYSTATGLIEQGGSRRGALMLTLHIEHPDIIEFITAKKDSTLLTNANLSVLVTDEFMYAVENDLDWELRFPDTTTEEYKNWNGDYRAYKGEMVLYDVVKAKDLWDMIGQSAWESAEPGVIFWDTVQRGNPLAYVEPMVGTNPCAEKPLPENGVCNLSSINLANMANMDEIGFYTIVGVRFLDNIVSLGHAVYPDITAKNLRDRRIGLGVLGLHDYLIKRNLPYGEKGAFEVADIFEDIFENAFYTSCDIANERGSFPSFDHEQYFNTPYGRRLPERFKNYAKLNGLRNAELISVAPTGTIATMLGHSTGIEPHFTLREYERASRIGVIRVPAYPGYRENDPVFYGAQELSVSDHLEVLAAAAYWTDSSISKTVNFPENATVEDVQSFYLQAYKRGIKGCTVYRDNSRSMQVLSTPTVRMCPECGASMDSVEGCHTCRNCGFSYCSI